jgi:hypothetical protein
VIGLSGDRERELITDFDISRISTGFVKSQDPQAVLASGALVLLDPITRSPDHPITRFFHIPSPLNLILPTEHHANGFGVRDVFLFKNS